MTCDVTCDEQSPNGLPLTRHWSHVTAHFFKPSHHLRLPGEEEEQDESEKSHADHRLNQEENEEQAIKKARPPDPIRNHADHGHRLEDRERQVNDIRIVEMVMVC